MIFYREKKRRLKEAVSDFGGKETERGKVCQADLDLLISKSRRMLFYATLGVLAVGAVGSKLIYSSFFHALNTRSQVAKVLGSGEVKGNDGDPDTPPAVTPAVTFARQSQNREVRILEKSKMSGEEIAENAQNRRALKIWFDFFKESSDGTTNLVQKELFDFYREGATLHFDEFPPDVGTLLEDGEFFVSTNLAPGKDDDEQSWLKAHNAACYDREKKILNLPPGRDETSLTSLVAVGVELAMYDAVEDRSIKTRLRKDMDQFIGELLSLINRDYNFLLRELEVLGKMGEMRGEGVMDLLDRWGNAALLGTKIDQIDRQREKEKAMYLIAKLILKIEDPECENVKKILRDVVKDPGKFLVPDPRFSGTAIEKRFHMRLVGFLNNAPEFGVSPEKSFEYFKNPAVRTLMNDLAVPLVQQLHQRKVSGQGILGTGDFFEKNSIVYPGGSNPERFLGHGQFFIRNLYEDPKTEDPAIQWFQRMQVPFYDFDKKIFYLSFIDSLNVLTLKTLTHIAINGERVFPSMVDNDSSDLRKKVEEIFLGEPDGDLAKKTGLLIKNHYFEKDKKANHMAKRDAYMMTIDLYDSAELPSKKEALGKILKNPHLYLE